MQCFDDIIVLLVITIVKRLRDVPYSYLHLINRKLELSYCKYPAMALAAEISTLHTASHIGFSVKFENVANFLQICVYSTAYSDYFS